MEDIRKKLEDRIRKIRLKKSLSQEDLAYGAHLHRTYISDIERGKRNISIKNI